LVPVGPLKVAAVVVPTSGVAPGPPRAVPPLARPVCVPLLVAEGEAVVTLAPPGVLVVEALVLVAEALVLEVAVEPVVVVVVEGLSVTAAATVWLLPTQEAAKESCARLTLVRSLPPSSSIAGATLACGKKKPLLSVDILPSFSQFLLASTKVGLPLSPSTGGALALLATVESTLKGWAKNCSSQGTKTQPNDLPT